MHELHGHQDFMTPSCSPTQSHDQLAEVILQSSGSTPPVPPHTEEQILVLLLG